MPRLPLPGSDDGTWGTILNDYLLQTHTETGSLKPNIVTADTIADGAVSARAIATGSVSEDRLSAGVQTKLNTGGIQPGSITKTQLETAVQTSLDKADSALQTAPVTSVNTRTGAITLGKSDVGLGNVDNTSDANKPVSLATQTALNAKAADANVVHLAGSETISGAKDFTGGITQAGVALVATDDSRLSDQRTPVDNSVSTIKLQDTAITEAKLSTAVQTKLNAAPNLADGSVTKVKLETSVQTSLDKADSALQTAPVTSVNTFTGAITLTKSDVGLGNADNTSDANKPVSTATQSALDLKADKAALEGYWVNYTPTFGGMTIGNAAVVAQYRKVGQTVDVMVRLVMGSTTTFDGGTLLIGLPYAPRANLDQVPVGPAYLRDDSVGSSSRTLAAAIITSNSVYFVSPTSPTTVIGTSPWTWAVNDMITFNGTYQAV